MTGEAKTGVKRPRSAKGAAKPNGLGKPKRGKADRIAVLERNIGELRERAGIPGGPEDKSAARQSDQDDAGPVKVDPESWSAL